MRKLAILTGLLLVLAACSRGDVDYSYQDLPPGDAVRGAELFTQSTNGAPACSGCHTVDGGERAGPTLQNYADVAGERVKGQGPEEYTFYALLQPAKHLVQGYSNVMPSNYEEKLSKQDTADLIAYMLSLSSEQVSSAGTATTGDSDNSMDTYMIVFRLIHIFAGVVWLGSGFFTLAFLQPALRGMGGMQAQAFMENFFKNTRFEIAMPLSGLLTTIAGIALYYRISDHFNADWMGATPGIVLSIGSVAGIVAFLHGSTAIGPVTQKLNKLAQTVATQGTPPTEEQLSQMRALQARTRTHGTISVGLMIIAVIGMVSARYL